MKDISEASASCKVTRRLLEKDVQKQCVDWARAHGSYARKFSSQSQRSVPDYICITAGRAWFVEFKKPGGVPTTAQLDEHAALRSAGADVYVVDSFSKFKELHNAYDRCRNI